MWRNFHCLGEANRGTLHHPVPKRQAASLVPLAGLDHIVHLHRGLTMAISDSQLLRLTREGTRPPGLTLAYLESGKIPIEWYEAVAIIQGLCRAIFESGDSVGPAAIDTSRVTISPAGRIEAEMSGPRSARGSIQRAGQLLAGLLPSDGVPVGLSTLTWKAVDNP